MRQLKKAASGVGPPSWIAQAPRPDEILFAYLHGEQAMSVRLSPAHLLPNFVGDAVAAIPRRNLHDSLASRIEALLEKKLGGVIKQFFKANGSAILLGGGLTKAARQRKAERPALELKPADTRKALLTRIALLERKLADAETRISHERDWAPLVKASAAPAAASIAGLSFDGNAPCPDSHKGNQAGPCTGFDLAGRCILCVGGRAQLYPEYRRLVETSGGSLLIYRSGPKNDANLLPALFDRADMVVCPADCVNHHTYFAVKRYCARSGKACVLLDRSNLPTFRKGVEALAALVAPPVTAR